MEAIRETKGEESSELSTLHNNLGTVLSLLGDLEAAEYHCGRAVEIDQKIHGARSSRRANSLGCLGTVREELGDYESAQEIYEEALSIHEELAGPDRLKTAVPLTNLGHLLKELGDLNGAKDLYHRALRIREEHLGPEHPKTAASLNNLGAVYEELGNLEKARELYEKALEIRRRVLGEEHPKTATSWNNLGLVLAAMGEPELVLKALEEALRIWERAYPAGHPRIATVIENLGSLFGFVEDSANQIRFFERALSIRAEHFGPDHPSVARSHQKFGDGSSPGRKSRRGFSASPPGCRDSGEGPWSWSSRHGVHPVEPRHASQRGRPKSGSPDVDPDARFGIRILAGADSGDGYRRRAPAAPSNPSRDRGLGDHSRCEVSPPVSGRFRPGLDLDPPIQRSGSSPLRGSSSPAVKSWTTPKPGKSSKSSRGRGKSSSGGLFGAQAEASEIPLGVKPQELREEVDRLEVELSRFDPSILEGKEIALSRSSIQERLPQDAALVELYAFNPLELGRKGNPWAPRRYAAYVLGKSGPPVLVDLGLSEDLDREAASFRKLMAERRSRDKVQALGRALDRLIFEKLVEETGQASKFIFAPDGELSLLPFAALQSPEGRFRLEDFEIEYVSTGIDLLEDDRPQGPSSPPLLLGGPDFGVCEDFAVRSIYPRCVPKLPGAHQEVLKIGKILGVERERILTGQQASEAALRNVRGPAVLHLATHAFFLSNPELPEPSGRPTDLLEDRFRESSLEPLLRSGLALRGYNQRHRYEDPAGNGLLTSFEVLDLDLRGTRLVTLSACDTGLGEARNGNGVFGLRRAFFMAGAENLLMTLWKVGDAYTRDFMVSWYSQMAQGVPMAKALRATQLAALRGEPLPVLRKGPGRGAVSVSGIEPETAPHPYDWASFLLVGGGSAARD